MNSLRKRDSIRRQKQLAARSKSRVLPWLRREEMEQGPSQTDGAVGDVGGSDTASDSSSQPSSPHQSQWTSNTASESYSSPIFSPSGSTQEPSVHDSTANLSAHGSPDLLEYRKSSHDMTFNRQWADQDVVYETVISRLYETRESCNSISPSSAMAKYMMTREIPSRILLSVSSIHQDIASGHQGPGPETLSLMVEVIRLLQQQLQRPDGVCDDTILTVTCLWNYEVTVSMGFPNRKQTVDESLTSNTQTHLNGLQRSIKCCGGLQNLSSETLWMLAWCVSTLPGYSPIDTRMVEPNERNQRPRQSGVDDYYCLTRLFDTLSKIHKNMTSSDSMSSIVDEPTFSHLRRTLLRLNAMKRSLEHQTTPMGRLRKSAALMATLFFVFDVLLGGSDHAHQDRRSRRNELMKAQKRLMDFHLDQEGSFEKAWQVLMTQQETPELRLHPRAWSVVEMVNVIKHLNAGTIDTLSELLMGYLLPETCNQPIEDFRYERMLLQITFELDGLADLS